MGPQYGPQDFTAMGRLGVKVQPLKAVLEALGVHLTEVFVILGSFTLKFYCIIFIVEGLTRYHGKKSYKRNLG